ncbi:uncharacterized protein C10orf95-like [Enhydra lutris kenyoni]|uniref:Uncharacterized protein C10orf95-like n=1 Tax=Enhydra lutris kenyoni TaxID=391180 RepID=A0A2Y9L9N7_ENHLU|nr:uncharacterized protein C10orf95-like [Enhydra lutris kenyoni]
MAAGVAPPRLPPPHLRRARRSRFPPLPLGLAPERAAALGRQPGPSRAHLDSGCGPGSRYTRARPPTARLPRAASSRLTARPAARRPDTRAATAVHRAPSTAWGPSDVGSPKKCLSRPRPLGSDSSSSPPTAPPPRRGGPASHLRRDPSPPPPRDLFCSCQMAARSQGCLAARSSRSFSFSHGTVRFAQNPVLFSVCIIFLGVFWSAL